MRGEPWNEECATAQRGFEKLGIECVPFSDNEVLDQGSRKDIVVGGMLVTGHALSMRGVTPPTIDYPESLKRFLGRRIWTTTMGEIAVQDLPVFVKPLGEKELPGIVAKSMDDLAEYIARGDDYQVLCSEPVEFVSEERLFIRYGELLDVRWYRGDPHEWCDVAVTNAVIKAYAADPDAPAGCSIDLGVTSDGRTLLVEINDGFALGCYGMDSVAYALLLSARWAQLVGAEDELAGLDHRGFPKERKLTLHDERLHGLLSEVAGSVAGFSGYSHAAVEWMDAEGTLSDLLERETLDTTSIWRWIAERQGLDVECGPDSESYVFPRAKNMRIAVRLGVAEPVGTSSVRRYDRESAVVEAWLVELQPAEPMFSWLYSRLADHSERDAKAMGLSCVFVLMDHSGAFPDEDFYVARGYARVADKGSEDLARALGANVIHDYIMEKQLDE